MHLLVLHALPKEVEHLAPPPRLGLRDLPTENKKSRRIPLGEAEPEGRASGGAAVGRCRIFLFLHTVQK